MFGILVSAIKWFFTQPRTWLQTYYTAMLTALPAGTQEDIAWLVPMANWADNWMPLSELVALCAVALVFYPTMVTIRWALGLTPTVQAPG